MKIASLTNDRKKIVKVLEEATGAGAVYLGAPSFGYSVGSYMVDRSGDITAEEMDQEVIDYAVIRMSCVLLFQWTAASYEVGGSALRGYGYSMVPAVLTVFGTCLLRIVWIHTVAVYFKTFASLLACYPFSWLVTGTLVLAAYGIIWRKRILPSSEV